MHRMGEQPSVRMHEPSVGPVHDAVVRTHLQLVLGAPWRPPLLPAGGLPRPSSARRADHHQCRRRLRRQPRQAHTDAARRRARHREAPRHGCSHVGSSDVDRAGPCQYVHGRGGSAHRSRRFRDRSQAQRRRGSFIFDGGARATGRSKSAASGCGQERSRGSLSGVCDPSLSAWQWQASGVGEAADAGSGGKRSSTHGGAPCCRTRTVSIRWVPQGRSRAL